MKSYKTTCCLILVVNAWLCVSAQTDVRSFAEFDREVKQEQWGGNKEQLSRLFDIERKRLGSSFKSELLRYINRDAEKHYWISCFLEEAPYLQGNEPLSYLSLLIKQQGLSLLRAKHDDDSLRLAVKMNVTAAILSERLGFHELAISHKRSAQSLLNAKPALKADLPAMSEDEREIYEKLEIRPTVYSTPQNIQFDDEPKTRMSGGVLNGAAIKLAMPKYPQLAKADKASGTITVKVVVDETGSVIWARAIEGHPLLKQAAEKAAYATKFRPPNVEGKVEKLSGFLIYNFVYGR